MPRQSMTRLMWLVAIVLVGVPSGSPGSASAGTTIDVDGTCTLVDALHAANTDAAVGACAAGSGHDTIVLHHDVLLHTVDNVTSGANGLPVITSTVTVDGAGHSIGRAAGSEPFRLFEISSFVHLHDMIIENGQASGRTYLDGAGGAIYSEGLLTITDSTVRNNAALHGGGIFGGSITLQRSAISGNVAEEFGGGIYASSDFNLWASTVSGNTAHQGGGIYGESAYVNIVNSTISGNAVIPPKPHLHGAGGIRLGADSGGTISYTTLANNSEGNGASVWINAYDVVYMSHNIVDNGAFMDCESPDSVVSLGYNIQASDGDCPFDHPTDISSATTNLGPLRDNDGATETHALLAGSDALDTSPPAGCSAVHDQRGVSRPQGAGCDSGAYEFAVDDVLVCGGVSGSVADLTALGYHVIVGSAGTDFLRGTAGKDFVLGRGGNDVILAGMGDDVVCAGAGHDVVVAGDGRDEVHAGDGNDLVRGGNDDDLISGGRGADRLLGGNGPDDISGDGADDSIRGGGGDDVLSGGAGRDDIGGDLGADTLYGDEADDVLRGHGGVDTCDGGGHVSGDAVYSCELVVDVP